MVSVRGKKSLELDFRVVKIDVGKKERRHRKLASTFSKPDLYHLQLAKGEAKRNRQGIL